MSNMTNVLNKTNSTNSLNSNINNNSNPNNSNSNNNGSSNSKSPILLFQKSSNDLQLPPQQLLLLQQQILQFQQEQQTPIMRYLPTYRLEPKNPINREQLEKILQQVVEKSFEDFQYESKAAQKLAKTCSEEIKYRFKTSVFDRFKIIVVVTIGEKFFQGFQSKCSFLWDPGFDGFINYTYDTPQYFVVATVYYLYYD